MKALTIWQPWASLIMADAKPWEWRGRDFRARNEARVGQRIVIHAGARKPRAEEIDGIREMLRHGDSSLLQSADALLVAHSSSWPLGCGLGTAQLGEPINAVDWAREHDRAGLDSGRVDHHQWGWPMLQVQRFDMPVPMRGFQGFWHWPEGAS